MVYLTVDGCRQIQENGIHIIVGIRWGGLVRVDDNGGGI